MDRISGSRASWCLATAGQGSVAILLHLGGAAFVDAPAAQELARLPEERHSLMALSSGARAETSLEQMARCASRLGGAGARAAPPEEGPTSRRDPSADVPVSVGAYAYLSRGPYTVREYVRDMQYGSLSYSMRVFYPVLPDGADCRPVIANIHPAQAIDATPSTQYWDVCLSAASYGSVAAERNARGRASAAARAPGADRT